jgi:sulfur-carrier protein
MKVLVYFFAQSREIAGESQQEFEIDNGTDVSLLLKKLTRQFPDLKTLDIRVAVNSDYAENSHLLHDGDEIAIIPPISGG